MNINEFGKQWPTVFWNNIRYLCGGFLIMEWNREFPEARRLQSSEKPGARMHAFNCTEGSTEQPTYYSGEESSWKWCFKVSKLNKKMVCAHSLNAMRHRARKVHRHKSGSGTDVLIIMGLDEFPKPDGKLNCRPYGKRQNMMVTRRKQQRKAILLLKSPLKL